jgi:hypothetical protein
VTLVFIGGGGDSYPYIHTVSLCTTSSVDMWVTMRGAAQ